MQVKAGGNDGAGFDVAEEAEAPLPQADGLEELDAQREREKKREREQVPILVILLYYYSYFYNTHTTI